MANARAILRLPRKWPWGRKQSLSQSETVNERVHMFCTFSGIVYHFNMDLGLPWQTLEQREVYRRHNQNPNLVNQAEGIVKARGTDGVVSYLCISSTKWSQVLIVKAGSRRQFPYNNPIYPQDPKNPWLITGYFRRSDPVFHTMMQDYWKQMGAPWYIHPFTVFKWNRNRWQPQPVNVDLANQCVRATVDDQTFLLYPASSSFQMIVKTYSASDNSHAQYINFNY